MEFEVWAIFVSPPLSIGTLKESPTITTEVYAADYKNYMILRSEEKLRMPVCLWKSLL